MAQSKHLLVVEDDFLVALDAEEHAQSLGFDVFLTDEVREAKNILSHEMVHGAIIDFNVKDGVTTELARALDLKGIPYFVVSGDDTAFISQAGIDPSRILSKPANYGEAIGRLTQSLRPLDASIAI